MPRAAFSAPSRVLVVVPAHNEVELIGDCLASLRRAAAHIAMPTDIVVVLDDCIDATASVVGPRARTLTVHHRNVGAARAAGFAAWGADCGRETWFTTTDADSIVDHHWLRRQLRHAAAGADVIVGTVEVTDWTGHPPQVRGRFLRTYRAQEGHRHVHGANLGMRADVYWAVGGFAPLTSSEDVDLVERVMAGGANVRWTADGPVRTSSRTRGRAPFGFAAYLQSLHHGGRLLAEPAEALT